MSSGSVPPFSRRSKSFMSERAYTKQRLLLCRPRRRTMHNARFANKVTIVIQTQCGQEYDISSFPGGVAATVTAARLQLGAPVVGRRKPSSSDPSAASIAHSPATSHCTVRARAPKTKLRSPVQSSLAAQPAAPSDRRSSGRRNPSARPRSTAKKVRDANERLSDQKINSYTSIV